ncbi:MAG: VTT domain-containing protein [Deltaproteobacteria bacterium]|nr:VTT domain-containing protein [Deltaproteobacteria bacterium]
MSRAQITRILVLAAAVGSLFLFVPLDALREFLDPEALRARGDAGGIGIVFAYLGAAALITAMTGQQALPMIGAATLFGAWLGPVLGVLAVAIGATVQFLGIRFAFREPAQAFLERRAPALASNLESRGLAVLVLLRFIWFPMGLTNMGAALTSMGTGRFVLAFPAMLPQALVWAFATDAIVTYGVANVPPGRWAALGGMILAAVAGYFWAVRRWPELSALRGTPAREDGELK